MHIFSYKMHGFCIQSEISPPVRNVKLLNHLLVKIMVKAIEDQNVIPPLVNDPRHWCPHPSLLPPLQSCWASPWPSIMERHRWQPCTCSLNQIKGGGKSPQVERISSSLLTEDSGFTTDGVGAGGSTGPPALSYLRRYQPRQVLLAHTQPNSVLSPTAPAAAATGESLTNMHCINATIGMSSSSRELSNIYNQSDHRLPNWDYQSKPMYEEWR